MEWGNHATGTVPYCYIGMRVITPTVPLKCPECGLRKKESEKMRLHRATEHYSHVLLNADNKVPKIFEKINYPCKLLIWECPGARRHRVSTQTLIIGITESRYHRYGRVVVSIVDRHQSGSGPGYAKMTPIRPDPDPQHCYRWPVINGSDLYR